MCDVTQSHLEAHASVLRFAAQLFRCSIGHDACASCEQLRALAAQVEAMARNLELAPRCAVTDRVTET